jgi:hypothetical protein
VEMRQNILYVIKKFGINQINYFSSGQKMSLNKYGVLYQCNGSKMNNKSFNGVIKCPVSEEVASFHWKRGLSFCLKSIFLIAPSS